MVRVILELERYVESWPFGPCYRVAIILPTFGVQVRLVREVRVVIIVTLVIIVIVVKIGMVVSIKGPENPTCVAG